MDDEDGPDDVDDAPAAGGGPFEVWPENWPAVGLFLRLQTQWRRRPDGALDGLRYDAAAALLQPERRRRQRRLMGQLIEMEHAVLEGQDDERRD